MQKSLLCVLEIMTGIVVGGIIGVVALASGAPAGHAYMSGCIASSIALMSMNCRSFFLAYRQKSMQSQ